MTVRRAAGAEHPVVPPRRRHTVAVPTFGHGQPLALTQAIFDKIADAVAARQTAAANPLDVLSGTKGRATPDLFGQGGRH